MAAPLRYQFLFSFLFLLQPAIMGQTAIDTTLLMSDGSRLDAFYCRPTTPQPAGGYPAILFVHGFGGNKTHNLAAAQTYARRGCVTTSYSVRGQGASEGEFDFFTSERIIADLRSCIEFTKSLPGVNPERVAVAGGSQGGIHAWAAAAHDLGVRTVVSIIANGRFEENWFENDAMNWTFYAAISTANVRFTPGLKDSITRAMQTGDYSYVRSILNQYTTKPLEQSTTTPTLVQVSYHDGFFNPAAALRQIAGMPSGTPKRIILYPGGHSLPSDPAIRSYCDAVQDKWFEYWLKDRPELADVASPDSAIVMFDGVAKTPLVMALKDSSYWLRPHDPLPPRMSAMTWHFGESGLTQDLPGGSGQRTINYVNLLGSTPSVWRTPPLAEAVTIAGAHGRAVLYCDGTGRQYQMELQLWDYNPVSGAAAPVTRGHYQVDRNTSGIEALAFDLSSILYTIAEGHQIEARVHAGIPMIPNMQNVFGNFVLGPAVASANTLSWSAQQPSGFTLYTITGLPVSSRAPAIADDLRLDAPWPNPAGVGSPSGSALVNFSFASTRERARLEVFDNFGRRIAVPVQETGPNLSYFSYDISELPPGVYHAVLSGASRRVVRPFIVSR